MDIVNNWQKLLNRHDVLILDTETTGVDATAEVVQVAVIDTTGKKIFNELVLPIGTIPEQASKIHGLTKEYLEQSGAKHWSHHNNKFSKLVSEAEMVLVYNLDFDSRILQQTCKHQHLTYQLFNGRCIMLDYAAYRQVPDYWRSGWKWHKLNAAAKFENATQQGDVHSAFTDCEIVLDLMKAVSNN